MLEFIIIDGLPYLYCEGKAYKVRWDDEGFTVGGVFREDIPPYTFTHLSEVSVKAKCHGHLDSIGTISEKETVKPEPEQTETVDLDSMKVNDLKEYAEQNGIELSEGMKKADILAAIKAVTV